MTNINRHRVRFLAKRVRDEFRSAAEEIGRAVGRLVGRASAIGSPLSLPDVPVFTGSPRLLPVVYGEVRVTDEYEPALAARLLRAILDAQQVFIRAHADHLDELERIRTYDSVEWPRDKWTASRIVCWRCGVDWTFDLVTGKSTS